MYILEHIFLKLNQILLKESNICIKVFLVLKQYTEKHIFGILFIIISLKDLLLFRMCFLGIRSSIYFCRNIYLLCISRIIIRFKLNILHNIQYMLLLLFIKLLNIRQLLIFLLSFFFFFFLFLINFYCFFLFFINICILNI